MKKLALVALVLTVSALMAQATPTVTLSMSWTNTTWQLYASVSSDCAGLASFDISFGGGAYGQVLTSTQMGKSLNMPFPGQNLSVKNSVGDSVGFASSLRSNGDVSNGAVYDISNGQGTLWTADGGATDAYNTGLVIQGIGITDAKAYDYDGTTALKTISAPVLIAQGTGINCDLGFLPRFAVGNVLGGQVGSWVGPGNVVAPTFVFGAGPLGVEPGSMALLLGGSLTLLKRRRK